MLGIIAKKDKQKRAIWGIVLSALSIGMVLIYWIMEDVLVGNYQSLIKAIIFTIIFAVMKSAGFFGSRNEAI